MRIVIVGDVDHGKSTLIGKLLHETNKLPPSKIIEMKKIAEKYGGEVEYANLLDSLEEEQKQNITIDTTQISFKTDLQDYIIIDAPGHKEFLKNMVTGASSADVAVLLIDAEEGVKEQTKRHVHLLSLLGIKDIVVGINKMDKVNYDQDVYRSIGDAISYFLEKLNLKPFEIIPISAKYGENISLRSLKMPWYLQETILASFDNLSTRRQKNYSSFRMPVQDIYKNDGKRIIAGRVESGNLVVGTQIVFSPSLKKTNVTSILKWNENLQRAEEGECIGLTIEDDLFIERGEMLSNCNEKNPMSSNHFRANIFWLGNEPLKTKKKYLLKLGTEETEFEVSSILQRIDSSSLEIKEDRSFIDNTETGEIVIMTTKKIALDLFLENKKTGRFVIVDNYDVCGGGIIIDDLKEHNSSNNK